jgi:hypothetical protein
VISTSFLSVNAAHSSEPAAALGWVVISTISQDSGWTWTATTKLPAWATPEGWTAGLRPNQSEPQTGALRSEGKNGDSASHDIGKQSAYVVSQIEAMAEPLGRGLYRGLLKTLARVWQPAQITDPGLLTTVLEHMQAAERGLRRLDQALNQADPEAMAAALRSLNLKSIDQVNSLETLKQVVLAVEARVKQENSST